MIHFVDSDFGRWGARDINALQVLLKASSGWPFTPSTRNCFPPFLAEFWIGSPLMPWPRGAPFAATDDWRLPFG